MKKNYKSLTFMLLMMIHQALVAQDLKRIEEAPMQMINGLPYLQAMINGKGPYLFGFDSGMGGDIQLDSTLAVELNLKVSGKVQAGDPSGKNTVMLDVSQIDAVQIGKVKFSNATAVLYNRRAMRGMENVAGILGITLFKDYVLTLDYAENMFYIETGKLIVNGTDVIPYEPYGGGVPAIKISVGNYIIPALIDTRGMASEIKIPESLIEKLHFLSQPKVIGRGRTISNVITINEVKLQETIKIGKHEFHEPTVTYPSFSDEAIIGARLLKNFVFSMDAKSKAVRLYKRNVPTESETSSQKKKNSDPALNEYAGKYGERTVFIESDGLYLQRGTSNRFKMIAGVTKDEYTLEGIAQARLVFMRDENGKIVSLKSLQPDGQWQTSPREFH